MKYIFFSFNKNVNSDGTINEFAYSRWIAGKPSEGGTHKEEPNDSYRICMVVELENVAVAAEKHVNPINIASDGREKIIVRFYYHVYERCCCLNSSR